MENGCENRLPKHKVKRIDLTNRLLYMAKNDFQSDSKRQMTRCFSQDLLTLNLDPAEYGYIYHQFVHCIHSIKFSIFYLCLLDCSCGNLFQVLPHHSSNGSWAGPGNKAMYIMPLQLTLHHQAHRSIVDACPAALFPLTLLTIKKLLSLNIYTRQGGIGLHNIDS